MAVLKNLPGEMPLEHQEIFEKYLVAGEQIDAAFQSKKDNFIFTNKRAVFVNQSDEKMFSIAYHRIAAIQVDAKPQNTGGQLGLYLAGASQSGHGTTEIPSIYRKVGDKVDIHVVHRILAEHLYGDC